MPYIRVLCLCCLIAGASGALAERLEIPLRVPLETLRQALSAQLAASPARPETIYRDGRCRSVKLVSPTLEAIDGRLRFAGPGSAAVGAELFGACRNALAWSGTLRFLLVPELDSTGRLRMRIVDSELVEAEGGSASPVGWAWDLSKNHVHPRLERFSYDVGGFRARLLALLRNAAPPEQAAAMEAALQRLELLEPRVESTHVVVPLVLEIPPAWLAAPPPASASAAPLGEAELQALEKALQPWDAFVAYSVKQFALDSDDSSLRRRLFTLLLESRYRLVTLLSGEEPVEGDPLRTLFIETWDELRAIVADALRDGVLDASLLRYAVFIDAGDALRALDRGAPGLGMRVSADGLRRLARSLRPAFTGDPLAYAWDVDPELRQLFDVEGIPETAPSPRSALEFLVPSAYAADEVAREETGTGALDRWVPNREELDVYQSRIARLMQETSAAELQGAQLAKPFSMIYAHLVPTTALIESCWRQYVRRGGTVSYVRSAAGSVGLMQVNQHVWRGFYDIQRLRWNTAYNARAGAQILMRYLKDYAIPFAERNGNVDHVPRAAYAVYNAGPRAVGRFAKAQRHPREERVDERLWMLYQGIASGGRADLSTCSVTVAQSGR